MARRNASIGVAATCASFLLLSACGEDEGSPATDDVSPAAQGSAELEDEMVLGFYGGVIGEAFQEVFVDRCSESLGMEIVYEEDFDAPRMTKMQSGASDIDVGVFTDPIMPDLRAAGLTAPLPLEDIPNYQQVPDDYKTEDSVPVSLAVWGITYDEAKVQPAPTSWTDLLDDKYAGQVTAPAITYNSAYLTLAAFQEIAGGNMTTNLEPGFELMKQLRENSPSFWSSSSDMLQQMQSGAIVMSPYASGSTAEAARQPGGESLVFVAPEEGAYPVGFNMIISSDAGAPNAAAAFINCVLDAENQAAWVELYPSFPANTEAEVPSAAREWLGGVDDVADLVIVDWDEIAGSREEIVQKWQREIG